ncbi:MAG TPA: hypothetical protein VFH10_08635 [Nocardioides sp.]|uniref:hypothetical protein n=1 Tax=Nocardioides sp. TaxID=35761 RepID=UPI002D8041C2|nr:hypothetical protein [Nocardioides sp.]HET6652693.1 hypothetical protein [Nocardioides sp.]
MRAAPLALTVALFTSLVAAGCSDATDDYCAALTDEKATLERLSQRADDPASGALSDSVDVFEGLRDASPEDIRDEWTTYVIAWQGLESALSRAGVDAGALADGEQPEGVTDAELDAVRDAADKMRSQPVVDAAGGIEQHATDVCGVDLGGSGL